MPATAPAEQTHSPAQPAGNTESPTPTVSEKPNSSPSGTTKPEAPEKPSKEGEKAPGALAQGIDLTLADKKGVIVARIKASTGAVGLTGPDEGAAGALRNGTATLFDKGKATATVTADRIYADQATRTITGKGNVVARSLVHDGAPTVRSDTMVWRQAESTIRGNGNVVMTQKPSVHLRGERFVANTELRKVEVFAE